MINGYTWIGNNRRNISATARRGSGGVGILVKDNLYSSFDFNILDDEVEDILWVKMTSKSEGAHLLICVCYLPPAGSSRVVDVSDYFDKLLTQVSQYQNIGRIVLGGDFNSRCANTSDYIEGVDEIGDRESLDEHENSYCNFFLDFLISSSFCMLNGRLGNNDFTSISEKGKSVVDYICIPHSQISDHLDFNITTVSDIANKYDIPLPNKLSQMPDHSVLMTEIAIGEYVTIQEPTSSPIEYRYDLKDIPQDFMNIHKENIKTAINRIESDISLQKDVNAAYNDFMSLISGEMEEYLHKHKVKTYNPNKPKNSKLHKKPWWCEELDQMWESVCSKEKAWLRHKGGGGQSLKMEFVNARRSFSYAHRKEKRRYQKKIQDELTEACDHNQAEFWKRVRSTGIQTDRKNPLPCTIKDSDGNLLTDQDKVKEQWINHFSKLSNENAKSYDDNHHVWIKNQVHNEELENDVIHDNSEDNLNCDISFFEVRKSVLSAKMKKACGTDRLFAEVFKNDAVITILHALYNFCFKYSIIPDIWKDGIIAPIYKAGDLYCSTNYRGITLQNVSCKIYSDILNRRLLRWMESNDKIQDEQNGFRPGRSCEEHIYLLNSTVNMSLSEGNQVFSCYVDFKQAFDRIDRDCLWYKLISMGVKGRIYCAIKSLYDNIRCCVRLNNGLGVTNTFPVTTGLKQGCNLSTSMFNIYINDLCAEINRLQCGVKVGENRISMLMYADDLVLLSNSALRLQQMLDCLTIWCKKWRMDINQKKTKIMHFRKKTTRRANFNFRCCDKDIGYTENYKYLGLWFNEFSDMCFAAREIAKSATRALGVIICKFKALGGLSYTCFKKLYDTSVESILRYGAGVWGDNEYKILNTVQNKAARFILGVHKTCANIAVRGELGWANWKTKQTVEVVRMWLRLSNMDYTRLTYKIFKHNCTKAIKCKLKNWEKRIMDLFDINGLSFLKDIGECDTKAMFKESKDILFSLDSRNWYDDLWDDKDLPNGNKMRTYRTYKSELSVSSYVSLNVPQYKKKIFSMLRCGCLPLEIEKGRHCKPYPIPLDQRKCKMCQSDFIEDEYHFVMCCNLYNDQRVSLFQHCTSLHSDFDNMGEHDKFIHIMQCGDYKIVDIIFKMFMRRALFTS